MIPIIPRDYFSGGRRLTEDPDAQPELADLIIELQQAVNAIPPPVPPVDPYPTALDILTKPPGAPNTGDRYLVNGVGAGAWIGHDYEVAEWLGAAWTFETYSAGEILVCSGYLVPGNAGLWQKGAGAWVFLGATTVDPCLDILVTDAGLLPMDGDRYLINGVGVAGFLGHDYEIAEWNAGAGAWTCTAHAKGTSVSVAGEITPANFGSYLKGDTAWTLIPAVFSALELAPNGRATKGRYIRLRNQVGDYTFTGYTPNLGTFIVAGNTNAGAGTYYFRLPQVGSTPTTSAVTYGWFCTVAVPTTARGPVVLRARNNAPICTIRPGEVWDLQARYQSGTTPASWDATRRLLGGGIDASTAVVWVDGARADAYTPTGKPNYPFKTIQAGLDACPRGGLVRVRKADYVENVVTVLDKHLDADLGAVLRAPTGCPLIGTDDLVPPSGAMPLAFWRGLSIQNEDASDWAIIVRSTGTWMPSMVMLDNVVSTISGGNLFWCDGGAMYVTDAGGTMGDAAICVRVGAPGTTRGGQFQAGKFNLECAGDGIMFDVYENGSVLADGTGLSSGNTGGGPSTAIIARMDGGPGGMGHGSANVLLRNVRDDSSWGNAIRAVGPCNVQILSDDVSQWSRFEGVAIAQEEGNLDLLNSRLASQDDVVFALGAVGKNLRVNFRDVEARTNGALARVLEAVGNTNGTLYDCVMEQGNPGAANGVVFLDSGGTMTIVDGVYSGPGPVIDQRQGHLWLTGGVDLVPTGVGLPGSIPLAVALGATVHHGHCNFRSGAPLIAGIEDILNSSFGSMSYGPAVNRVRKGAGPALPGAGAGYGMGSEFTLIPVGPGAPTLYVNVGTEGAPTWVVDAYTPAVPGDWNGAAPTSLIGAMDRVAAILKAHGIPA
jgi:hypothetical protein